VIALLAAAAVAAPAVDTARFRYVRTLRAAASAPAELVPDGPLLAHTRPGLPDLRIVDARGGQVPWRPLPAPAAAAPHVRVLDRGRTPGGLAVALLDLGAARRAVDRLTLVVPPARFDGPARVSGSDDRRTWTVFAPTQVYDVGGATPARSTTVLLPASDFRYLRVTAPVPAILGATVDRTPAAFPLRRLPARVSVATAASGATTVTVDLGYRQPVDELRLTAGTPRYDRPFVLRAGGAAVGGELVRAAGRAATRVPVDLRVRRLRIEIRNGDDPPLRAVRVEALARPRPLLVEGGHPGPLTLYYGGAVLAPSYDFARLPAAAVGADRARRSTLGPERTNGAYAPVDRRSFVARHAALVTAALAVAAAVVLGVALLAVRRG
jgi:Protein of unknown function (DUF3999)